MWENIIDKNSDYCFTKRLKVPGGWLVISNIYKR